MFYDTLRLMNAKVDAGYPRQDGKTPWSFTPVWYWDSVLHVQDRWEA